MLLLNKRIFMVEDNLSNRVIMTTLLEQEGAKTGFERWGTDTIRRLRDFAPVDIILLDLMFTTRITGLDIFDAIRSQAEFASVPIVAVSAKDPSIAIPETRAKGFAGFIAKPLHFDLFAHQIAQILNDKPIWSTGQETFHKGVQL